MVSPEQSERLFDLASYARRGPGRRDNLSRGEIAQISRTVRRVPEVMVKVLSRGGQDLRAVTRHIDYLRDREDGERTIETDDGRQLAGGGVTKELLEDWDLELEAHRNRSDLSVRGGGSQKLVHKLLFSMPPGTPPEKVLSAVKNLAREEFGLKHRYAMVLHTDEPHPHVHIVLKAVSEQGVRLHIRKQTLRHWRQEFARHLRALGVAANATDRFSRGVTEPRKLDGIYRPAHPKPYERSRFSTHMRGREEAIARELKAGSLQVEPAKATLLATRRKLDQRWGAVSEILLTQGHRELAADVLRFVAEMPPALTEKENLAKTLLQRDSEPRSPEPPRAR
jgi:Relaxase/Mobilisation nuclease domain